MKNKNYVPRIKSTILTFILAVCTLVASGCGQGGAGTASTETQGADTNSNAADSGSGAKGRYMETQMTTPDGVKNTGRLVKLADGKIAFVDGSTGTLYTSSDQAKTWESSDIGVMQEFLNQTDQETGSITTSSIAKDGAIFYTTINWGTVDATAAVEQNCVYLDAQGNPTQAVLSFEQSWLIDTVFSENGDLYGLGNDDTVYQLDIANSTAKEVITLNGSGGYYGGGGSHIASCAEGIAAMDGENYYYYDSRTGQADDSDKVLGEFIAKELKDGLGMGFYADKDNIYTASASGLYSHVKGGNVMEELLSSGLSNMGDPRMLVTSMLQNDDGSFLIGYDNGEIYSYVYDPDASAVPDRVLNIYGLKDNDTVRRAISSFRKANPDIFVKYEIGLTGEDSVTESDAITALNTQLLAGEGPDIILLDGMPMNSYIEKGLLEDLSGVIEDVKKESNFFENILEAYSTKDGIYSVPLRYYIPVLTGKQETLDKIKDLGTLAEQVNLMRADNEKALTVFNTYEPKETLLKLYLSSSPAWMKDGELDEAGLKEFLTQAKSIYEADQKNLTEEAKKSHQDTVNRRKEMGIDEEESILRADNETMEILSGYQMLSGGYMKDMSGFSIIMSVNKKSGNTGYQALAGQAEQVFVPNGILGISTQSKEKENAEAFLKLLLGQEVQGLDLKNGFPVNADAYTVFCTNSDPESMMSMSTDDIDGNMLSLDIIWPSEEDITALKDMIGTLKTPCETDSVIKDTVLASGTAALTGEKSIEESVDEIKQKISLYLAE